MKRPVKIPLKPTYLNATSGIVTSSGAVADFYPQ